MLLKIAGDVHLQFKADGSLAKYYKQRIMEIDQGKHIEVNLDSVRIILLIILLDS